MLKKALAMAAVFAALAFSFSAKAVSARAYALVDGATGRLIGGQNIDMKLPMASTTKIMTALLACESGRLDTTVTVKAETIRVEGSSMGLLAGERITMRELVYGLLLESGNDAANVIACELGGSLQGFADRMNERAAQLGLTNTHYVNPSGLDAGGHYTSACDLARLGAAAMKNPDFARIAGTKKISISYDGKKNGRTLVNHNRLLSSFPGMTGIKTGFTKKDGRCLVTSACRDGVTLVLATLDDPDDWDDHEALLNKGFQELKSHEMLDSPVDIRAPVAGGTAETVAVGCSGSVTAALRDSEVGSVRMEIDMDPFLYAPIRKGQVVGHLVYKLGDETVASADLYAAESVARGRSPAVKRRNGFGIAAAVTAGAVLLIAVRFVRRRKEKETA